MVPGLKPPSSVHETRMRFVNSTYQRDTLAAADVRPVTSRHTALSRRHGQEPNNRQARQGEGHPRGGRHGRGRRRHGPSNHPGIPVRGRLPHHLAEAGGSYEGAALAVANQDVTEQVKHAATRTAVLPVKPGKGRQSQ